MNKLLIIFFLVIAMGAMTYVSFFTVGDSSLNEPITASATSSASHRDLPLDYSLLADQRERTGIAFATFDHGSGNSSDNGAGRPAPPRYWKDKRWLAAVAWERAALVQRQRGRLAPAAAAEAQMLDAAADDTIERSFSYDVSGGSDPKKVLRMEADCGVPKSKLAAFERAWSRWQRIHAQVLAGERPPRFVHVGFPHKSSVLNRLKTTVSAFMLALVTDRAFLVSWTRNADPDSVYRHNLAVEDLFLPPPFNWTYDFDKFHQPAWQRFNVTGFGLEDYVETEPLHELFCADFPHHRRDTVWWEFPWKYGWFGSLLYHSPFLHEKVEPLFGRHDMFGWLARKLFRPHPRIWRQIDRFKRRQFDGHRVVGVELVRGHGGMWQFQQMLKAINNDVQQGLRPWHADQQLPAADNKLGGLIRAPKTKMFVVLHDHSAMKQLQKKYGDRFQFLAFPHANYSAPGNDGELIDSFLLGLCDAVYATPWYVSPLGAFFSKQARIVLPGPSNSAVPEPQCQPCVSMSGVSKTTCYSQKMDFPEPSKSQFKCNREYPIF